MTPPLRLVFAGTPEFAVPAFEACLASGAEVVAVYTQPDRPAGRGRKLWASPVKQAALAAGVPVEQPQTLRDKAVREQLAAQAPDLLVVVAYGLILPKSVLALPRFGCWNVHASLLPRWRGAAPIQRAILAGDEESGVDLMQMEAGLDTGPVLLERRTPLEQHGAGVEAGFHLHQVDAAFFVTGEDRALDRRRAAPARQQRGMHVPAAEARQRKHGLRQDQAIGDHHQQVGRLRGELLAHGLVAQRLRLLDRHASCERGLLDRTRPELASTPRRPVRLGVDRHHLRAAGKAGLEGGNGEFRRSGEHQSQWWGHRDPLAWRSGRDCRPGAVDAGGELESGKMETRSTPSTRRKLMQATLFLRALRVSGSCALALPAAADRVRRSGGASFPCA
jgi:folate-dependent phosphoribosylglycinamide formyltransferase PurN